MNQINIKTTTKKITVLHLPCNNHRFIFNIFGTFFFSSAIIIINHHQQQTKPIQSTRRREEEVAMSTAIQAQAELGVSTDADYFLLMLQNGELSDLSSERALEGVKDHLKSVDAEVRQLEMHLSKMDPLREIPNLFDRANGNATSIVAHDALGFGDMWSKGLSFMDLMYVKLSTAISSLARHLEQAARIVKLEQEMDKSNSVRSDVRHESVNGVCDNLSQLGYNLDSLNQMVSCMKDKIMSPHEKQGLKALADNLSPECSSVGSDNQPRRLTRTDTVMYSS